VEPSFASNEPISGSAELLAGITLEVLSSSTSAEFPLPGDLAAPTDPPGAETPATGERLLGLCRREFAPVWRLLRRLGLNEAEADDAVQQVFLVASRRLREIEPERERGFLFATAVHVASKSHRTRARRREVGDDGLDERRDSIPGLEELVDRRRAREMLDEILDAMPDDLRVVFALYEIEELTMSEISTALDVPHGTVASRLRRARADFSARVARIEARMNHRGGSP
jgi:RNA polymerase sigma-70 factor (ECF subfamily)